jgi:guanylate kinase
LYLIIIAAPSGAGKTTLCKRLLQDFPTLVLSISSTTRPPRGQEKSGIDYFFLTLEEFQQKIQNHDFVEWAKVHSHFYGTSKTAIETAWNQHKSVLLDIDIQGAEQLRQAYPKEAVRIFIAPPNLIELEKRLRSRGTDSEETIQKRLKNAQLEMELGQHFDHWIVNDSLDQAYTELKTILETHYSFISAPIPARSAPPQGGFDV